MWRLRQAVKAFPLIVFAGLSDYSFAEQYAQNSSSVAREDETGLINRQIQLDKNWSFRKKARYIRKGKATIFDLFNCVGSPDVSRWRHDEPLHRDQFICTKKNSYVWGLTNDGDLMWMDLASGTRKRLYRNKTYFRQSGKSAEYFMLSKTGDLEVRDSNDDIIWTKSAPYSISPQNCLSDYECPYLHLHGNNGKNVLNFISESGQWITTGMNKVYGFQKRKKDKEKTAKMSLQQSEVKGMEDIHV
mmetsp:Transcript_48785/g.72478  ORF Transcript_48785/g.72478 Transcript_48785/m.72478 type:complete len:245 (-) Transcript_48785:281-1015(-)|eukprot:CAMPEP_0195524306 /NCGR_PEP_ID=MMETSP0794_2-20130614/24043_1 /TAXON_ID=515487 /ORGANISM="Stephanopyxis turris, Strain CCMP 815" /LENGTH=244 /DNA_ID=CAMNT_0040654493 /DNA_START=171 /DNA_END=905 /DNA_ORIENTATION=+